MSIVATGGTITTDGGDTIHTFTTNGSADPFVVTSGSGDVEYLVVGGGAGGGGMAGGGAGRHRTNGTKDYPVTVGSYTVTVGAGGAAAANGASRGTNGGDSVFDTITSEGGGGGGAFSATLQNGLNGGSGGGGGASSGAPFDAGAGGTSVGAQGNSGGAGENGASSGGGGGGAGAVGEAGGVDGAGLGGDGGDGVASSITGSSVTRAGGGGGPSGAAGAGGTGGTGGGGNGRANVGPTLPTAGTANTGGGGGGGYNSAGADGGSGVVIIRYRSLVSDSSSVSGSGSVVSAGSKQGTGTVSVSNFGATTATGKKDAFGSSAASGSGSASSVGGQHVGDSSVSGSGSVTALGKKGASGAASVAGYGGIVAFGVATEAVEQEWIFAESNVLEQEWVLDATFLEFLEQEWVWNADIRTLLEQEWSFNAPILDYDVLEAEWTFVAPILGAAAQVITDMPTVTIRGQVLPIESASVTTSRGQRYWTCQITLTDPRHYALFHLDDAFTVNWPGEDYAFLVNDRAKSRPGQVDVSVTISGVGPGARFEVPRAEKITRSWDEPILASAVVEELFGAGVVQWQVLDWTIPAFRLGVQDAAPMDVLVRLAAAPGGVVQSDPDGTLRVVYRYAVSVPLYGAATPDQVYTDAEHNFSDSARASLFRPVDKLRILDVEPGAGRDTIEFEQDPETYTRATLRVFPSPWRTEVTVTHTSDSRVSAAIVGEATEELTETVEVIGGKGSVSRPIFEVLELEWLFVDLSGVAFETDANGFTTTHETLKESLLRITYTTRFIEFEASAFPEAEVQFLVLEEAA